ncbi:aspartyl-phosphate phosphatase Spo0E family protein [Alkalihalophilus sp. As8PL]|jgi:stage 0 sporulation regulatory protein|uniref:Aspartyl-phosphate phosphatase Spo0E family protein n=1 Tax=Alkalihalophilus sp. As8PL TaxID=3237103 RepID=A0AB39BWR8_9BACI
MMTKNPLIHTLESRIEATRQEMIKIGLTKGLQHPETIKLSQRLDLCLNKYNRLKSH